MARRAAPRGWESTLAGLEVLLAEASSDMPQEIKDKAVELMIALAPAYKNRHTEWQELTEAVREQFGLTLVETDRFTVDVPREFVEDESFESLVVEGWFADYLAYTGESEAPTQFHFGSILTCVAAVFGRKPLLGWQAAPLYPNIYTLLVGPTGTRKSTALGKARELVEEAFPVVNGTPSRFNVLSNEGSPQGYARELRSRNFQVTDISDGLLLASELTVMIGKQQYQAALGNWLVDWYDNLKPVWSRALKGEETYELPKPYVCFAGASNMTWLREIPDSLIKAGYMPRHLVFNAAVKRHDKADPRFDAATRAALAKRLAENCADIPVEMPLAPDAADLMNEWYMGKVTKQERAEVDDLFGAWLQRKLPHALKIATVWQIVDGGPKDSLRAEWLRRAIHVVDWMDRGVLSVYYALGSTSEGAVTDDILRFVKRKGGTVTLPGLIRSLRNKYNKESVEGGVRTLVLAKLIKTALDPMLGSVLTLDERDLPDVTVKSNVLAMRRGGE